MNTTTKTTPIGIRVLLLGVCVAAVIAAVLVVGPPSQAQETTQRVITAQKGVVQSTVSGDGTLSPTSQEDVNFATSGTLEHLYISAGQHVQAGELLAELSPEQADVALLQAKASLGSDEASLEQAEDAQTTAASASTTASSTSTASGASASTAASSAESAAMLAANVGSARASVAAAELAVQSAEETVTETKLYAPTSGTVASVADVSPGDSISAGSGSSGSSASTGSGATSGSGSSSAGSGGSSTASASSSGSTSSSSSAIVTIVDLSSMDVVVPFTESDIGKVKVGQSATVTVDALADLELAAQVTNVSLLATTSGSVTSYDVTVDLDQADDQLKPGMSATVDVVVSQAQGAVSVPSTAISRTGGTTTVTVLRNGKDVVTPVTTGVVGDSTTQILSGVTSGEQIVIVTRSNLGSSSGTASSTLGGSTSGTLGTGTGGSAGFGGGAGGGAPSGGPPGAGG